jgi:hypothetical protein
VTDLLSGARGWLVAAVAAIALAGCGGAASTSLPTGSWGRTIACVQNHPLFDVYDAYSTSAQKPNAKTKAVVIWQDLKGTALAYIGNSALGADDLTGSDGSNVDQRSGVIRYGFTNLATPADQLAISTCVGSSSPSTAQPPTASATTTHSSHANARTCRGSISAGPDTSCPFAEAVAAAYQSSPARTVTAKSSVTGLTYTMQCVGSTGTVTCTGGRGARVLFASAQGPSNIGCPTGTYQRGLGCYGPGGTDPAGVTTGEPTNCPPGTKGSVGGCATPCQITGTCAHSQTSSTPETNGGSSVETAGSYSHAADAQFCTTNNCIANFPNGNGYIVQCVDGGVCPRKCVGMNERDRHAIEEQNAEEQDR